MSLFEPLFVVCERSGDGILNEPVNVVSTAVFFVAAWLLWREYRKNVQSYADERLTLIALMASLGAGTLAFHTLADELGMYAAFVPLALFLAFAFYIVLRRVLGYGMLRTLLMLAGIWVLFRLTTFIPIRYRFNDTVAYLPFLGILLAITGLLFRRRMPMAGGLLGAAGLLALALVFLSLDIAVCPRLPSGTYFLWHLCEGLALYRLAKTIHERRGGVRSPAGD